MLGVGVVEGVSNRLPPRCHCSHFLSAGPHFFHGPLMIVIDPPLSLMLGPHSSMDLLMAGGGIICYDSLCWYQKSLTFYSLWPQSRNYSPPPPKREIGILCIIQIFLLCSTTLQH